jgi:hypothetical protein
MSMEQAVIAKNPSAESSRPFGYKYPRWELKAGMRACKGPERALRIALLNAMCSIEAYALDANSLWHSFRGFSPDLLAAELAAGFVACLSHAPGPARPKRSRPRH